jgi:hypothetical protein
MSELLAAIPRLFSLQRRDDYAPASRGSDLIAQRALSRTIGQLNSAYAKVTQKKPTIPAPQPNVLDQPQGASSTTSRRFKLSALSSTPTF